MWLFRAFCTEKVRDINDTLRADLTTTNTRLAAADANYKRANKELATCQLSAQRAQRAAADSYNTMKDIYLSQLAEKDELIARMDAELTEVSGRLADAEERNALIDREEDMRDEIAAKRRGDV